MQPRPLDPMLAQATVASPKWRVERAPTGCLLWTGRPSAQGYGRVTVGPKHQPGVHRVAFIAATGEDTPLTIDHLCRVRMCVEPTHLEAVPNEENIRRGEWAAGSGLRGTCKNGHPFTAGSGYCRPCHNAHMRETAALLREAAASLNLGHREYIAIHGQGRHEALRVLGR